MLTVVRNGVGFYYHGSRIDRVTRGDLGLVLPSRDPGLLMADSREPYDHYYCRFAGQEALRMARAIVAQRRGIAFGAYAAWPEAGRIFEVMLVAERQSPTRDMPWMSQTEGELARLLALLLTTPAPNETSITESGLRRYLLDHLAEPLDLEQMAQHFGVGRHHLSRRAHALLGVRLGEVSRSIKLDFSISLLEATSLGLSIEDVALRVGYADPLYFSKVFHKHVGKSPSQYRADLRRVR
jgi:AraC-like DNA-binding protein